MSRQGTHSDGIGAARRARPQRRKRVVAEGRLAVARSSAAWVVTLEHPPGNRLTPAMAVALMELVEDAEDDGRLCAIVIQGAGDHFCTGIEAGADPRVIDTLAALSVPVIAIVAGDAIDGGLELALAADIRVGGRRAKFAWTRLRHNELPCFGGTQRLPRLIGASAALRMLLTGAVVAGREALDLGLISYLARDRAAAHRLGARLCQALAQRGPLALRLAKEAVHKGFDMTLAQGIRLEEDLYALLQTTADRAEGISAFLERRRPLFKGE